MNKNELVLNGLDAFLITSIIKNNIDNENKKEFERIKFNSGTGASLYFSNTENNKECIKNKYGGNVSRFRTAKINTIKKRLENLKRKKLIIGILDEDTKKTIYFPNPEKAFLWVSKIPDGKKQKKFLCCRDYLDRWTILQV